MPLAGTFDVLDFGEVLNLLSKRSATGRLQLRTANMHGIIWLAEGRATSAEIGTSSGGETRNKWRSQLDDICFDALRSSRGSFEFHPEDEVSVPAGPRVRLETLLANGRRRIEIWQDVESVIHSFEAVPRLAEALNDDSLTVSQDRWKVLVAIDGRRTVAALARRMDIELLEFCQLLKPLVESGAVLLDQPEGWLKSLPKVRLDVAGPRAEIDPALLIDVGGPEDGMAVLSVNSTVVPPDGNGPWPAKPVPLRTDEPAPGTDAAVPPPGDRREQPPETQAQTHRQAQSELKTRRRLRGRSRARAAGPEPQS